MYSFSQFLDGTNADSNRDVVGLSIYYLHTYGEEDTVAVQEIRTLFDTNNFSMSETTIAAHIVELHEEGLITRDSEESLQSSYFLSRAGFRIFGRIAGEWGQYGVRYGRFINTDQINDEDYKLLVTNINRSYRNAINDGTLVLTRKRFENLIIDVLRTEFGGSRIGLYYNTNHGRFHGLGRLCRNLKGEISNLDHYSRQLNNDLISRIEEFKKQGNSQAHSVRIGVTDDGLEDMRDDATDLTKTLWNLREEVRLANN